MTIRKNHPIRELLFFVAQDFDDSVGNLVRETIESMATLTNWVIAPPEIVEEIDEIDGFALLGGALSFYSVLPEESLPEEINRKHLHEVRLVLETVAQLSGMHHIEFHMDLDGELIGSIRDGQLDSSLRETLLGEWERTLNEEKHAR